jgi:ABC-type sugar transport system substrate-binding protein
MTKGITVVTYDSDAPSCRNLFVNQASTTGIGDSLVDLMAKEIHDAGDIGIVSAAQVVSSSKYKGKVIVTGLGTPDSMKTYVANGVVPAFELWSPANLGYLAAYAAVNYASKKDHQRRRPVLHRRQAGQVHGGRRQHHPARPPAGVHCLEHRAIQLLSRTLVAPGPAPSPGRVPPGHCVD